MSRLTNCCGCSCDAPLLPEWSVFGPTASEDGGRLKLESSGDGGVTTIEGISMVFASLNWSLGKKPVALYGLAEVASSSTIEVPLWCDENGENPQALVRLKIERGEKFCSQKPSASMVPETSASLPTSHLVTRDADVVNAGTSIAAILGEAGLRSSWRSLTVTLELDVDGSTVESVLVPYIARAIDRSGLPPKEYAIGMQVFAAREDGELDIAVALSDRFEELPPYPAADVSSGNVYNNALRSLGLQHPAQWHLFDTVTITSDAPGLTNAGITTPTMGELQDEGWQQGDVTGFVWGYQTVNTHTPGIPADDAQYCDENSDDYIPPLELASENDDRSWGDIPWVHTPCTRWKRRSRITQSLDEVGEENELESISIQFPPLDEVVPFDPANNRDVYGFGLLGNTIELTGFKDGQRLADNTFWYEAEPGVQGEGGLTCESVQVSAVLCAEVGRSSFQSIYGPAPPCDDLPYEEGWRARLFLNIVALINNEEQGKKSIYRGSVELSMKMNSRFMRGNKINSYGVHLRTLSFTQPSFYLNGWQPVWPEYVFGSPATRPWFCYRIEIGPGNDGYPPIDQDDDAFTWWRVQLL